MSLPNTVRTWHSYARGSVSGIPVSSGSLYIRRCPLRQSSCPDKLGTCWPRWRRSHSSTYYSGIAYTPVNLQHPCTSQSHKTNKPFRLRPCIPHHKHSLSPRHSQYRTSSSRGSCCTSARLLSSSTFQVHSRYTTHCQCRFYICQRRKRSTRRRRVR